MNAGALRSVALVEACKGLLVLLAGLGLLALLHRDVHAWAARLILHTHLNPASHYPRIFLDAASQLNDPELWLYAAGAAAYAGLRLAEAYGLWHGKAWAEWLAALSGGVYVPFELAELLRHPGPLGVAVLLVNLLVVALMVRALRSRALGRRSTPQGAR